MSRIRSIHPGFKTDEDFVTVSRDARLFYLLLLGECDDQGIFEWKPTTLKMRIFPADNVDVGALLSELEAIDALKSYEIDDRQLGVVRNFRKYQRPKSPNAIHLKPDDWGNYVGLCGDDAGIDLKPNKPVSPKRRKPSAEGGGRREDEGDSSEAKASGADTAPTLEAEVFRFGKSIAGAKSGGQITKLCKLYHQDLTAVMAVLREAKAKENPAEWIAAVVRRHERVSEIDDLGRPISGLYDPESDEAMRGVSI